MTDSGADMAADVEKQRNLVANVFSENLPAFHKAVEVLPVLIRELGLGEYLGALRLDHKPRLLYSFAAEPGSLAEGVGLRVVLKVYGDRPRGEGPLQRRWRDIGLATPRLLYGEERDCSWLVIEQLQLSPVQYVQVDGLLLLNQLARMGKFMHQTFEGQYLILRPLSKVMLPRWEQSAQALIQAGHRLPSIWQERAAKAYQGGAYVPLHGDLAPANMGLRQDKSLIVFDASALEGTAVFDAARWSARVGPEGLGPEELFERWLKVEGLPLSLESWDVLAAECVLEAGSLEIVRFRSNSETGTAASGVPELLEVAARWWG